MSRKELLLHEILYRDEAILKKFGALHISICGAGSLGANLTESLARHGFLYLTVIDRDRVEVHNLANQPYFLADVGAFKATILANYLYRAVGVEIVERSVELTSKNSCKLLQDSDLVVDTFDNATSRQLVRDTCLNLNIPCLHLGMSGDGYGEAVWDSGYRIPQDQTIEDDPCNYPLARNLVQLLVAVGCEVIIRYVLENKKENYNVTLKDFHIQLQATCI